MKTFVSPRSLAISAIVVLAFGANAEAAPLDRGKTCQVIFDENKAAIDSMAMSQNSAGIQGFFTAHGCPGTQVSIANRPLAHGKQLARVKCTMKLIPPTITCTFGVASIPMQPGAY